MTTAVAGAAQAPPHNISAANLNVIQNDSANTEASVTVTTSLSINDMRVRNGSNRGDYNVQVGDTEGTGSAHNNWPDKDNNHGETGTCMNFCDGHAQWIKKIDYLRTLNTSQDANQEEPD